MTMFDAARHVRPLKLWLTSLNEYPEVQWMELISEQEFPDLMNHNANSKEPIGGSVCALSPEKGVYFGPTWGF